MNKISNDLWKEILSQIGTLSPKELSRRYPVTAAGIHYQIKKRKIDYNPIYSRKYFFNERFFETIDSAKLDIY